MSDKDSGDSERLVAESEMARLALVHAASLLRAVAQDIQSARLRQQLLAAAATLESIRTDTFG